MEIRNSFSSIISRIHYHTVTCHRKIVSITEDLESYPSNESLSLQAEAGLMTMGLMSREEVEAELIELRMELSELIEFEQRACKHLGIEWCGKPECYPLDVCYCEGKE